MSEQDVINILFCLHRDILQGFVLHGLHCLMLTPKYSFKKTVIICGAIDGAIAILVGIFLPSYEFTYFIFLIMLYFVPALFAFKEKRVTCMLFTAIFTLFIYLCDMILGVMLISFDISVPATRIMKSGNGNWTELLQSFGENIAYMTILATFVILWCRKFKKWQPKISMLFFLFPVSQLFFFSSINYRLNKSEVYQIEYAFIVAALIISILADVLMFIAIRDSSKLEETRMRMLEIEREMNTQLNYYKSLSEHIAEVRQYKHDINNLVSAAEALTSSDASRKEGELLINELREKAKSLTIPAYCDNAIVNAVLWQKKREMDEKGLTFDVRIKSDEDFPLDKVDICSVFANLLDNAIREAENGEISVSAVRDLGMLIITVSNPTSKSISENEKPKTTKKDRYKHGLGLDIVEKIAEKYNGKFILKAENGTAKATAAFTLQ